ncbi:MAG: 16S rRNA (cytosine(1402)-N(4))-methyltransferase RsmH [Acidobacteria bacterium]|nr:16S rRNA (cytosine(1402)-N(4))-methyltransferase RsmH [Acidobacteriota bacterium]
MHIPVLPGEAMEWLAIRPEGIYVDATTGAGGHARRILESLTTGRLIALDRDPVAIGIARENLSAYQHQLTLLQENFAHLPNLLRQIGVSVVDGILADLGLSQMQIDFPERGFSLKAAGPLDMRMDPRDRLTAEEIVNHYGERELADLIYQLGEERRSQRIARAIVRARPIRNTVQLANLIVACLGSRKGVAPRTIRKRIHPATQTFQALRMAVNRELELLEQFLKAAPDCLAPGGRLVIISFHSLEDRLVKQSFRNWDRDGWMRNLTRHVVKPSPEEVRSNPRSRSARLRAAERLAESEPRALASGLYPSRACPERSRRDSNGAAAKL